MKIINQGLKPFLALVALVAGYTLSGCSDSVDSSTDGTARVEAEMSGSPFVSKMLRDEDARSLAGVNADSLRLTRARILISRIKLHRSGEDTTSGDKDVRTGPIVVTIDSLGARVVTSSTVPAGTYDKIKFEFHRFSSSEVATYLNDPVFGDFVNGDRWTFIFDGTVYTGGTAYPFTYRSDATANLSYNLSPNLTIAAGDTGTVVLQLNVSELVKEGNNVLDPRDPSNESKLDNAIKAAIHALRR